MAERREQLAMMLVWREGLKQLDTDELAEIAKTEYNWTSLRNQIFHLIQHAGN